MLCCCYGKNHVMLIAFAGPGQVITKLNPWANRLPQLDISLTTEADNGAV